MHPDILVGGNSNYRNRVSFDLFLYLSNITHFTIEVIENKGYSNEEDKIYVDQLTFYSVNSRFEIDRLYEIKLSQKSFYILLKSRNNDFGARNTIIDRAFSGKNFDATPILYFTSDFFQCELLKIFPRNGDKKVGNYKTTMLLYHPDEFAKDMIIKHMMTGNDIKKWILWELPDEEYQEDPEPDYGEY